MSDRATRRDFLKQAAAGAAAVSALAQEVVAQTTATGPGGVPTRLLGRTGERVSILALGGWHIGTITDEAEAMRIMHAAIDEGITFFDNAWDYHDGRSEELMGKALAMDGRRQKVFLMTKNCDRDYEGSHEVPRGQPAPAAHRPHRPVAVPRDGLRQRSRLGVREGRPARRARGAEGGQGALHRLHRPQAPRASISRCSASRTTGTRPRCRST